MSGERLPAVIRDDTLGYAGVTTTATSLTIEGDLSWDDWEKLVVGFVASAHALPWYIGDAVAWGEHRYGESYAQVSATLEQLGYHVAPKTLQNWIWVATNIAPSRRRDDVLWSVHAEVAKLPPDQQDAMLARAAREGWSVRRMRDEVAGLPKRTSDTRSKVPAGELLRIIDTLPDPVDEVAPPEFVPYELTSKRREQLAGAQKRRLVNGSSTVRGVCEVLLSLDYAKVAAVCDDDELEVWARMARDNARALGEVAARLDAVKRRLAESS